MTAAVPDPADDPRLAAARQAMSARDFARARLLWRALISKDGQNIGAWLGLAAALRASGDLDAALNAVDGALAADPLGFTALLWRASLLERLGRVREAGPAYGNALNQAPPEDAMDASTRAAVAHARAVNRAYALELEAVLRVEADWPGSAAAGARGARTFIDSILGKRTNYRQEPVGYFYPGLPAIEFWDREEFPWLEPLEAATADIQAELAAVLRSDEDQLTPYIDYADTIPLDQWKTLNRSRRWSAFHLIEYGGRVEANAARCPQTIAALARCPQPIVPNRSPAAMFSVLDRRTHIPPHTGVSNTRLVCHLPLVVPHGCRFRVGNDTRTYEDGRAWVFDDTIEHEAWNDSDETRIILLFDVWNPRLSLWEREAIARISAALDAFNGEGERPAGAQKL